ncbi:MAG: L,D-transpeptidase family protein [Candidatus Scalinduaceae bacterium]
MRILISAVFIASLFCFYISQEYMHTTTYAYGGESTSKDKPGGINQSYLLAKKEDSDYIFEKDIIITTDDLDKEKKQEKKEVVEKDKEIVVKEKQEKKDSQKEIAEKVGKKVVKEKGKSYTLDTAYETLEKGDKYKARNIFSALYFAEADHEKRNKIKTELDKLNAELVFSMAPSPDAIIYTVKPGDTFSTIASEFNTSYELIMKINNKGRPLIRVGEKLKVLKGEISLLVDKSDFTLTVLLDGHFIKQYPVGIGMFDKTPEDVFLIKDKLKNPTWYSPEGVYEYGDPRNLLGTRWMGFEDKEDFYGYGIHGTSEPETIGKPSSNGCIRLLNEDAEELFKFVKLKTKVVIQK